MKGSGGDLGTLTEAGLAVLRLDRLRALVDVYPGVEREDEMVAAFDYCLHGKGGAAPSIDTAMHGLVDAAHVDHLHPDSGIAIATAADGEELTNEIFGDRVVWVPWRRPGFQLGLDIAAIKAANPQAIGCILGGHGITAWGDTSDEAEANSLWIIETAADVHRRRTAGPSRSARRCPGTSRCRRPSAGPRPPRSRPHLRGLASTDRAHGRALHRRATWCSTSSRRASTRAGRARHLLPRPLPAHQGQAAGPRPAGRRLRRGRRSPGCEELHDAVPRRLPGLLRPARRPRTRPPMRGADPAIVLVPGVGMFSYGADKQTARVAGEFYVNAINVMRGAEALSTLRPDRRGREVPHRVLGARGGQAAADAEAEAARRAGSRWSPGGLRASARPSPPGSPPRARASSSPTSTSRRRRPPRPSSAVDATSRSASRPTSPTRPRSHAAIDAAVLAFGGIDLVVNNAGLSISKPLLETTERRLGPAARRDGQGLLPRLPGRGRAC